MRRGFTIIELIVVLVVMAILLTLSTLMISRNQANARDSERNADMANLARGLETRYKEGNPEVTAPSYVSPGSYPGTAEMQHIMGVSVSGFTPTQISGGYPSSALPGTTYATFSPPGLAVGSFAGFGVTCTSACGAAANLDASITKDTYVYQPIDAASNVCIQGGCVRFRLYWRTEADGQLHVIESKHQ